MPHRKCPDTLQSISLRFITRKIDIWCRPKGLSFSQPQGTNAFKKKSPWWTIEHELEAAANPPLCELLALRKSKQKQKKKGNGAARIIQPAVAHLPGPYSRPVGFSSQPAELPVILPVNAGSSDDDLWEDCPDDDDDMSDLSYVSSGDEDLPDDDPQSYKVFEFLSSHVIQDLLDSLIKPGLLGIHHLRSLLNPGLSHLSLVHTPYFADDDIIVDLVRQRCPHLTRLSLNLPKCNSKKKLAALIKANPKLIYLNLSLTSTCTDELLGTIAKHCKKLKELYISSCPISDVGVHDLTDGGNGDLGCPELVTLDLRRTTVTTGGVAHALECFKHLQNIYHVDTFTALCSINTSCVVGSQQEGNTSQINQELRKTYKLKTLESFFGREYGDLKIAVSCCPYITDINLLECDDVDTLEPLCNLKHLRKMSLKTSRHCFPLHRMDFKNVLPILEALGNNLENIQLISFEEIDISAIIFLCKNLQTLIVDLSKIMVDNAYHSGGSYSDKLSKSGITPARHLETVSIINGMNCYTVPKDCLIYLLSNCLDLTWLILDGVLNFDSKTFNKILDRNPMRHVKKVELTNCPSLSIEGVHNLLNRDSNLERLDITSCVLLSYQDKDSISKFIQKMRYDLAFTMIVGGTDIIQYL